MTRTFLPVVMLVVIVFGIGCGKGWRMDYGQPVAQFLQEDVEEKGKPYIGQKITVKGTVAAIDTSDPAASMIKLTSGITCDLGTFKAMAESVKAGDTVYVDGFLKRCEKDDVVLAPAMLRDSKAPFNPKE